MEGEAVIRFQIPALVAVFLACPSRVNAEEPAECVTTCGLRAPAHAGCARLQALELRLLMAFEVYVGGWKVDRTCKALEGWRVYRHPTSVVDTVCHVRFPHVRSWLDPYGECISGLTAFAPRAIEIADFEWNENAMGHELVHVLQNALGAPIGHCHWPERGYSRSIAEANGTARYSVPVERATKDCPPLFPDGGTR
jgi:hypothetical protein